MVINKTGHESSIAVVGLYFDRVHSIAHLDFTCENKALERKLNSFHFTLIKVCLINHVRYTRRKNNVLCLLFMEALLTMNGSFMS